MPAAAFALALARGVLHAVWNLLLASAATPEAATAVALARLVVFAPIAAPRGVSRRTCGRTCLPARRSQLTYFALLGAAYRRAELSVVYPLARGLAPVSSSLARVVHWRGDVLVAGCRRRLVAAGCSCPRSRGGAPGGVAFGLAIAACIAAYTVVDKSGIPTRRRSHTSSS